MNHHTIKPAIAGHSQRGLSLIELMIALTVGLVILAGVLSLFLTNKQSYTLQSAVARIQENGRFSLDFMRPQLRLAGYSGCGNSQSVWTSAQNHSLLKSPSSSVDSFGQALTGYDYNGTSEGSSYAITTETPALDSSQNDWTPSIPVDVWTAISSFVIPGSDIIMIHSTVPGGLSVQNFPGNGNGDNVKTFQNNLPLSLQGQIAIVTDCTNAATFQITNVQGGNTVVHSGSGTYTPGNKANIKIGTSVGLPATLLTLQTYVYFIGRGADNGPALFVAQLNGASNNILGTPQELVPGVESMQILYGVDASGSGIASQYVSASDIGANWSTVNIVSVRIGLLVRSDSGAIPASNITAIPVNGVLITPPPTTANGTTTRRMRKVFLETIALRNHLP